jgi:hypothetical protein
MRSQFIWVILVVGFLGACLLSTMRPKNLDAAGQNHDYSLKNADAHPGSKVSSPAAFNTRLGSRAKSSHDGLQLPEQTFEVTDVIHRALDFPNGQFKNMAVTDALRLSNDNPAASNRLDQIIGIYISPQSTNSSVPEERMPRVFDRIAISFDGTIPDGAGVKLELRTIRYDEDGDGWEDWREIPPQQQGKVISLSKLTERWQYRLTLTANDLLSSPEIHSVSVSTSQSSKSAQEVAGIMAAYYQGKLVEAEAERNQIQK